MNRMWGTFVLALCCWVGCAPVAQQYEPLQPAMQFPDRAKLSALAATPLAQVKGEQGVAVPRWTLVEARIAEPEKNQAPWLKQLNARVKGAPKSALASPQMRCLAEQYGRFRLKHGGVPDSRLQRFMAGHCGADAHNISSNAVKGDTPDGVTDQAVYDKWHGMVDEQYAELLKQGAASSVMLDLGVWYGRAEGRGMVSVVAGMSKAEIEPLALATDGQPGAGSPRIEVRGKLRKQAVLLRAVVNQGAHGVAICTPLGNPKLPNFAFSCPLASAADRPWIELIEQRPGRLLGNSVALLKVPDSNSGSSETLYEPTFADTEPAADEATFRTRLLTALNQRRATAKLPALTLAPAQTAFNQQITPHLFSAAQSQDTASQDFIALGLLAGHDIKGTIRRGDFFSAWNSVTMTPEQWLDFCLQRPIGRESLMSPDMQQIAIGSALGTKVPGTGSVVTLYSLFRPGDDARAAKLLQQRLTEERRRRGKAAPVIEPSDLLQQQAALITSKQKHPRKALDDGMRQLSNHWRANVRGMFVTGTGLANAPLPDELLEPAGLTLAIGVTHIKLPQAAWGQHVVLLAYKTEGGTPVAKAPVNQPGRL